MQWSRSFLLTAPMSRSGTMLTKSADVSYPINVPTWNSNEGQKLLGYSLTLILDCQSCMDIGRQTSTEPVDTMNELVNGGVTGVVIITALLEITSCV
jgi:hypothetical protein